MKKIIILLSILAFIAGYFIIFSEKEKEELSILLLKARNDRLKSVLLDYSEKNNIEINIEETGFFDFITGIEEKHRQNKNVPDIFIIINDWLGELAEKGIIEKIDKSELKKCMDLSKEAVKYKGEYFAYPFEIETLFLFYNKKFVKEAPENIEELLKKSKEIKEKFSIEGLVFPMDEYYYHYPWYRYYGGSAKDLFYKKVKNLDIMAKELKVLKTNFRYGNVFMVNTEFIEERAGMLLMGNWEIENLKKTNLDIDYKIIKDKKFKTFIGVKAYAIYKRSKNKKSAKKLLKYLETYEIQKKLNEDLNFIPVNKELLKKSKKKIILELKNNLENLELMPNNSNLKEFWRKGNRVLNRIYWKGEDIDKVLKEVFGAVDYEKN